LLAFHFGLLFACTAGSFSLDQPPHHRQAAKSKLTVADFLPARPTYSTVDFISASPMQSIWKWLPPNAGPAWPGGSVKRRGCSGLLYNPDLNSTGNAYLEKLDPVSSPSYELLPRRIGQWQDSNGAPCQFAF
jgi:hypothetical protein